MQTISWTELYPSEQTANDRIRAAVGDDARYYDMQAIGNEYYAAIDKAMEELNCFCIGNGVITDNAGVMPEDIRAAIDQIDYRAIVESHALPRPTEEELAEWDARHKKDDAQMQQLLKALGINSKLN